MLQKQTMQKQQTELTDKEPVDASLRGKPITDLI